MLFTFGSFIKHFRNAQINKIPRLKNGISALFMCLFVLTGITLIVSLSEWRGLSAQNTNCSGQYAIDELLPTGARWQMCWEERLREGVILYDVYYTPRGGTAHALAGVHRFKVGFGGRLVHREGCWDFPFDDTTYAAWRGWEEAQVIQRAAGHTVALGHDGLTSSETGPC